MNQFLNGYKSGQNDGAYKHFQKGVMTNIDYKNGYCIGYAEAVAKRNLLPLKVVKFH